MEQQALRPQSVIRPDGTTDPALEPVLSEAQLLRLYRGMLTIRLVDTKMLTLQRQGRIAFYGTATGEEAAIIGPAAAIEPRDWVFPALRDAGAMLYRGWSLEQFCHQMWGTANDTLKGRMQPCHPADKAVNQVSWSSTIATQLPHAMGMAMAAKLKGDDIVALAYVGDGGTSEGDFHVAMNFAGVYRVPLVTIIQNNQWAISVPASAQSAAACFAIKGEAYGIPWSLVDGNDVLAMYGATAAAVARARTGGGPTLIEARTYRMGAHSTSDDASRYRPVGEVELWQRNDPIDRLGAVLRNKGLLDDAADGALREEITATLTKAIEAAERAPPPALTTLFTDVFKEQPWHLREAQAQLLAERREQVDGTEMTKQHSFP